VMENFRHSLTSDNAGDFRHAAGEREKSLKCGCHPRDAGDLAGLLIYINNIIQYNKYLLSLRKVKLRVFYDRLSIFCDVYERICLVQHR